jgi:hypothetical protein
VVRKVLLSLVPVNFKQITCQRLFIVLFSSSPDATAAASNSNPRRFLNFSSVLISLCRNLTNLNFCWLLNQVSNNGWAEGECRGKAGWFPAEFIEKRDRVLASKVAQVF